MASIKARAEARSTAAYDGVFRTSRRTVRRFPVGESSTTGMKSRLSMVTPCNCKRNPPDFVGGLDDGGEFERVGTEGDAGQLRPVGERVDGRVVLR